MVCCLAYYTVHDLHDLCDLYDLYDLYDLDHVVGREPPDLHDLASFFLGLDLHCIQIPHNITKRRM